MCNYGDVAAYSFNVYKTITAGDGGMLGTNDKQIYERSFAIHDQGHLPLRQGVEEGSRTVLGLDLRMTELAAAVLLAQLKKMGNIRERLRKMKQKFKRSIEDIRGIEFRRLTDPEGDLGSLLVVFLPDEDIARKVGDELGCGVIADSGWHVYNNMEHVLGKKVVDSVGCPFTCPYYTKSGGKVEYSKGMLPNTDAILKRAINISIGVFDKGLGSGFGLTVTSDNQEIDNKIETFRNVVLKYV